MKVLVIDVGGTHVKILATGQKVAREFESAPRMTPEQMVAGVKTLAGRGATTPFPIGYPGAVAAQPAGGRAATTSAGAGWTSISRPHSAARSRSSTTPRCRRLAAITAARCCSWASAPGLGTAMIVEGVVVPMELAHLPYRKATLRGLCRPARTRAPRQEEMAASTWHEVIELLRAALLPDEIVLGGGNAEKLADLPPSLPARATTRMRSSAASGCGRRSERARARRAGGPARAPRPRRNARRRR